MDVVFPKLLYAYLQSKRGDGESNFANPPLLSPILLHSLLCAILLRSLSPATAAPQQPLSSPGLVLFNEGSEIALKSSSSVHLMFYQPDNIGRTEDKLNVLK